MVATAEIQQVKQRFGIIGNSTGLLRAVSRALQIAPTDLSVLITGESGTGKENFPQILHANSARKHGRYIAVNCGEIPEGTVDSELFGHEKGSFTGALSDRKGYFEEADGGTIFLDEVGELPMTTQARLLRVLENGEFIKVGSSKVQKTNVRIIAATNVNMMEAIAEGRFRGRSLLPTQYGTYRVTPSARPYGRHIAAVSEICRRFCREISHAAHTTHRGGTKNHAFLPLAGQHKAAQKCNRTNFHF